jgi:putative FmdB family regulatory protein
MPIYEYQCQKCGLHSEVLQKFSDPAVSKCEACNGKMKKLISQSAFHLKGSGWYVTDYAAKSAGSRPAEGSSEKREASPASTESAVKAETKTSSECSNAKDT